MTVITRPNSNSDWRWSLIIFDALLAGHAAVIFWTAVKQ